MVFTVLLYISLAVCLLGVLYRMRAWFHTQIGPEALEFSPGNRVVSAVKGMLATIFSLRIVRVLWALVIDVFLQARILRDDFFRWLMHILLFSGFLLLVLTHALEGPVSRNLFPGYESTLNPFLFLRNLFGAMVLVGIVMAVFRRARLRKPRLFSRASDGIALGILGVILFSGFLLEGVKILSPSVFHDMVEEYSVLSDPEEIEPLRQYWAKHYGVVFSGLLKTADTAVLEEGRQINSESCADCHSRPGSAFLSYPVSRILVPAAPFLDRVRADVVLGYMHFIACFLGLAYLPFSKYFHLVSSTASLLAAAGSGGKDPDPANRVTRRALALDACTHCGACSEHCSVRPVFHGIPNPNILPSEKLLATRTLAEGRMQERGSLEALSVGSHVCTSCYRCTSVCPVGIDLQDLWSSSRKDLIGMGFPEPHIWVRESNTAQWVERIRSMDHEEMPRPRSVFGQPNLSDNTEAFFACVQCQTCTNVCPVVACSDIAPGNLGLTPQQIMNLLRLGLKEHTLGAPMVWDCVTCYMCQEHCPEGIRVADIFYELRNIAYKRFQAIRLHEGKKKERSPRLRRRHAGGVTT